MIQLHFPDYPFKIKEDEDHRSIFDLIRKRYVHLSPEEWVRQNLLAYLTLVLEYPKGLIAVEREIKLNGLKKRYDIVVFNHQKKPWMLVEVKEPAVHITEHTLAQLMRYHQVLQCPYWLLSNGHQTFCASVAGTSVDWLATLPPFEQ